MTRSARRTVLAAAGAGRCADTGRAAGGTGGDAGGERPGSGAVPGVCRATQARAREQGISQSTLDRAFAQIHFVDRVIKADRNQPEQKVTTDDYLRRVMSPAKVRGARTVPAAPGAMDARQRALSGAGALYHRAVGHGKRLR